MQIFKDQILSLAKNRERSFTSDFKDEFDEMRMQGLNIAPDSSL